MTETTEAHASAPSIIEPVPIMNEWITCSWYVATVRRMRTPPRQKREDVKALEAMQTLGIPAWYATGRRRERRANGKKRMSGYLMFPGYLFIAHDGDRAKFARSLGVRHITGMLGCDQGSGFVPLRVPSYAMQALFAGEELRQHHLEIESEPLKKGESVNVIDGPFAQFDGEVNKIINADRIEILLEILGSHRPVEIPVDKLRRL